MADEGRPDEFGGEPRDDAGRPVGNERPESESMQERAKSTLKQASEKIKEALSGGKKR
jgi:uncharacterized protein YjbJ (UPF0337 family)